MDMTEEISKIKKMGKQLSELIELQEYCIKNSTLLNDELKDNIKKDIIGFQEALDSIVIILKYIKSNKPILPEVIFKAAKEYDDTYIDIQSSINNYKKIKIEG